MWAPKHRPVYLPWGWLRINCRRSRAHSWGTHQLECAHRFLHFHSIRPMDHLHLLLPDLFLPPDIARLVGAGLHLPILEKILARAEQHVLPVATVEDFLCDRFAAKAVAPVRATCDGLNVGAGFWLCADPVNLQLQQSQVVLQPDMPYDEAEAAAICATLNKHFAEDGLTFFAPHPKRWYVCCDKAFSVTMTPLRVAAWRDVKPFQPQGADALVWKRLANEMQMLLHDHPVNQARVAKGQPAINSLWLWGAGLAGKLQSSFDAVGGDDGLSTAFARVAGASEVTALPDLLHGQMANGLWVNTSLSAALQRGDMYDWREAIKTVEREIAQPVWQALRSGHLQTVTLDILLEFGTRSFTLNRARSWKIWRRSKQMASYVAWNHSTLTG